MAETMIKVQEGMCGDGCGKPVNKGRRFLQGHDARLRSSLVAAFRAGEQVTFEQNGSRKTQSAEAALKAHGFPIPKPKAPRKSRAKKATAKATAKRTRKTRKPRTASTSE